MKKFETMGVMLDMSRNAVMSLDGIKRFIPLRDENEPRGSFLFSSMFSPVRRPHATFCVF